MDRIGPAGGSPTTALSNGQQGFQDENLAAGIEGTTVVSEWLNAVQEEFMTLLATAGITPNIANFGQVLASIVAIFGNTTNAYVGASGNFSFMLTGPGGVNMIVCGGPVTVPVGQSHATVLLPVALNSRFLFGLAGDTGSYGGGTSGWSYGVTPGADLAHAVVYCGVSQVIQSSGAVGSRGIGATGYYIVLGL